MNATTTTALPTPAGAPPDARPDPPPAADLDATLKALCAQPGVEGALVYNELGIPVRWTPGVLRAATGCSGGPSGGGGGGTQAGPIPPPAAQMAAEVSGLVAAARGVAAKLLGPGEGEVSTLRLRSCASELIVTPAPDGCATLVVLQRARSRLEGGGAGAPARGGE